MGFTCHSGTGCHTFFLRKCDACMWPTSQHSGCAFQSHQNDDPSLHSFRPTSSLCWRDVSFLSPCVSSVQPAKKGYFKPTLHVKVSQSWLFPLLNWVQSNICKSHSLYRMSAWFGCHLVHCTTMQWSLFCKMPRGYTMSFLRCDCDVDWRRKPQSLSLLLTIVLRKPWEDCFVSLSLIRNTINLTV